MTHELKTKPTQISPAAFMAAIANEQTRKGCRELMALMREVTRNLVPGLQNEAL